MRKHIFAIYLASLFLATVTPSFAGGGDLGELYIQVAATVPDNCAVVVLGQPSTLNITPGAALPQEHGQLEINCTNGTPYHILLGTGLYGVDGNVPARYMCGPGCNSGNAATNGIAYQIYQDFGFSVPWGNSASNQVNNSGAGMNVGDAFEPYFYVGSPTRDIVSWEIQAGPADYYSDSVLVTMAY